MFALIVHLFLYENDFQNPPLKQHFGSKSCPQWCPLSSEKLTGRDPASHARPNQPKSHFEWVETSFRQIVHGFWKIDRFWMHFCCWWPSVIREATRRPFRRKGAACQTFYRKPSNFKSWGLQPLLTFRKAPRIPSGRHANSSFWGSAPKSLIFMIWGRLSADPKNIKRRAPPKTSQNHKVPALGHPRLQFE